MESVLNVIIIIIIYNNCVLIVKISNTNFAKHVLSKFDFRDIGQKW